MIAENTRKNQIDPYQAFLQEKVQLSRSLGLPCAVEEVHPLLKPHQAACVQWAVQGGRRALFESFGLGKTMQQLEVERIILLKRGGGRGLIVCPLGVRQEFMQDAAKLGTCVRFVRRSEEVDEAGIYLTNYESIRDGRLDPSLFDVVSLDEASCLRSFGSKTFGEFLFGALQQVEYRYVATATPSPNQYLELIAYAAFLGIMDMGESKTRFFKRNSEKAHDLTILPHKEEEFWLWVASWALFLQRPSDLGPQYSDAGYLLPEMQVVWHEVAVDHATAPVITTNKRGQSRLFREAMYGVSEAAKEKRDSLPARIERCVQILEAAPDDHFLLWHDLEAERRALEQAVPGVVSIYGTQELEARELLLDQFSRGKAQYLAAKPILAGSGCNFQYHCHKAIFLGIGFKFNDFIQAIHRIQRFLQPFPVEIHLLYAESERSIRDVLVGKWERHKEMTARMSAIIREHGLSNTSLQGLTRGMGIARQEARGERFTCVNNDAVEELPRLADNSIGMILTSIPFSTQYEYSPNYSDFGHTDSEEHFFRQMDFLTPHLLRVLQPGRVAAIHVKDRVVPGGMNGLGFQTITPFHADCIRHYMRHGFAFMGMKTIVTDVVRENNQTYRLGWTEQCKDGTKMGYGMPEYLLLFRKPPTDTSNSYADTPVVKSKAEYTRARWQIDADGFARSSGNRLLLPEELAQLPWKQVYRLFRAWSSSSLYDFEAHVRIAEALEAAKALPVDFALVPARSWHPDVWTDVARMRTLNGAQAAKGKVMHLCPLQFDIVDRAITQLSMPDETLLDPFAGIMTVPFRAVKLGRKAVGIELNAAYWQDGVGYCKAAESGLATPSLFDLDTLDTEEEANTENLQAEIVLQTAPEPIPLHNKSPGFAGPRGLYVGAAVRFYPYEGKPRKGTVAGLWPDRDYAEVSYGRNCYYSLDMHRVELLDATEEQRAAVRTFLPDAEAVFDHAHDEEGSDV